MIVGVLKEIKDNENRVALIPVSAKAMVKAGHTVLVEAKAGEGCGLLDERYLEAGAQIIQDPKEIYAAADMIMKVKEPLPSEFDYMKPDQILFTYLHLAADKALTVALMEKGVAAVGYETVQLANGTLPLLTPMSEVAGRMAIQIGANHLEKQNGGSGVLLGGVPGVEPGYVVILGGGVVGINAARIAIGLGATVVIVDKDMERARTLDNIFQGRVKILMSNSYNIEQEVARADLLVGAVLLPGGHTPQLVSEAMVKNMKPGSVIVDVAIDQGGCIETCDHTTTHSNPTYVKHGVIHYSVGNMPGAVARTSTFALTNVTFPYAFELANLGIEQAVKNDPALALGVNIYKGTCVYPAVAQAHDLPYTRLSEHIPDGFFHQ